MHTDAVADASENVEPTVPHIEPSAKDPLVSIVIPCFNHAHFLSDAISSVLTQTFRDFEIIVVDDGGTDNAAEVVARFGKIVRYNRKRNEGLSRARNTGMMLSRGRYILFLDADDMLLPEALEAEVRCLEERPRCAFVSGAIRVLNGDTLASAKNRVVRNDHYTALLRGNYIQMPGAVLYRRDRVMAEGGFDPELGPSADYDLYLRIARCCPVMHLTSVFGTYRVHNENMSADHFLMLRYSLRVLFSQWRHVKNDRRLRHAFFRGLAFWLRIYGPKGAAMAILPRSGYRALRSLFITIRGVIVGRRRGLQAPQL